MLGIKTIIINGPANLYTTIMSTFQLETHTHDNAKIRGVACRRGQTMSSWCEDVACVGGDSDDQLVVALAA